MDDLLATAEKKALIEIVKLVQKRGLQGTEGGWKEFLNVYDRKFGACLSDPARRSSDVLIAFLKTFDQEDHLKFLANVIQSYSKRNIVQQFTKSPDEESPEQRLVRLTVEHPQYPLEYAFPSNGQDWVVTKPGKKSEVMRPDRILAVDCEMVLCEDGTEALVRVCVVDRNLQVKLDELVNPNKPVADYRSEITGVTAADLEGIKCSLSEIQRSMKKLLAKGNILVGHSLSNDLNALKVDHAWVIDTSYIFKYSDVHFDRRPSLNNLCKTLLGYELRKNGAPHNCLDDACAAMKLVIARIEQKAGDAISLAEMDVPVTEMSKLFIHRIPENVPAEDLHKIMLGDFTIEIKAKPYRKTQANKYSAFAIFKSPKEAKRAYKEAKGIKEKDSFGRSQKLITIQPSTGKTCDIYIRKMARSDCVKGDLSKKRVAEVEDTSNVSKKRKMDDDEIGDETMGEQNEFCDTLEEIKRSKQEIKQVADKQLKTKVSKKKRKDKKGKKNKH